MTMFLTIMLTFVITLVVGFFATHMFIVWLMSEDEEYREYWRRLIKKFSDESDDDED